MCRPPQVPHTGTVPSPGEAQHRAVQVPRTCPHQTGASTDQGLGLLSGLLGHHSSNSQNTHERYEFFTNTLKC